MTSLFVRRSALTWFLVATASATAGYGCRDDDDDGDAAGKSGSGGSAARAGAGGKGGSSAGTTSAGNGGKAGSGPEAGASGEADQGGGAGRGDAGAESGEAGGGGAGDGGTGDGGTMGGRDTGGVGGESATGGVGGDPGDGGLRELAEFSPQGKLCGVAYDDAGDGTVWVYQCSAADIRSYSTAGTLLDSIDAPGEAADDADLDFAPEPFTLNGSELPASTLLFVNGETATAEVYALDAADGSISETLATGFGASHVVGGAYHLQRDTFFAVQDRVPGSTNGNLVAEISPQTGVALNVFSILPDFDVNYGDLDVCQSSGNLFIVSSIESAIAEFTPAGTFVAAHPLPQTVTLLSGLAIDDSTGEAWVSSTSGNVWRIGGLPCP